MSTTNEEFSEMSYREHHRELKKLLGQAQRISTWFNAAERLNLLPALLAMKERLAQPGRRTDLIERDPENPTWEQECRLLGISADLVKKWKQRTATDQSIRKLVGEEENKPGKKVPDAAAQLAQFRRDVQRLCQAWHSGEEEELDELFCRIADKYEL